MKPDLKAIRERAEKATPGPWEWEAFDSQKMGLGQKGKVLETVILGTDRCKSCAERNVQCLWPNKANAEFIAHARTDIPALLDYIKKLEYVIKVALDGKEVE